MSIIALDYPYTKERYIWKGIPVYPMGASNKKWKKPFLFNRVRKVFEEIHREKPVTILHSFWLNQPTMIAHRLSVQFGIPVVASSQGQEVKPENPYLKHIRSNGIPVVALGAFQEELLLESGIQAFDVISPEVSVIPETGITLDIIGVGNLIPLKNFEYLVELLGALKQKGVSFSAKIVGEGPEFSQLSQRIEILGLSEALELTGLLPHAETLQLIASAKVLVHPSHFEGYGLVIEEALESGTHVMAQPVGAAYENEHVVHLAMHRELDAELLQALLQLPPKARTEPACFDMIRRYNEVYDRLESEI